MNTADLKPKLISYCDNYIDHRLSGIQAAMADAQASANNETKSSAGDKHETGRAMAQLETENQSKQLSEAIKLRTAFNVIKELGDSKIVGPGSLVQTNGAIFYLAIGIGAIKLEGQSIFVVTPTAPIALSMKGKAVGDELQFNGKTFKILAIG